MICMLWHALLFYEKYFFKNQGLSQIRNLKYVFKKSLTIKLKLFFML